MESSIAASTVSILAKLLADKKEDTRKWLGAEMDRLVDSMFLRLTNKLMKSDLEQYQSDCAEAQGNPSNHIEQPKVQQHQPSPLLILQFQTANFNPQSNHQQEPHSIDDYEPENDPKILAQVKREIEEEEREMQLNIQNIQIDDRQGEGEETLSESIKPTGQQVQSNHKPNSVNDKEYKFKLNFNDCVNVGMERIKREAENDDGKQVIEDDDQVSKESSRPVKKPRLDQPNNAQSIQQGSSQPKQPNQVPNHDYQLPFITIRLQCPESDCLQMIPKAKFVDHLKSEHSISPFRCAAKDCDQSFSDKKYISHIKFGHLIAFYTNEWQCDKCSMQFHRIAYLNNHTILHHQLGQFRCSFSSCTFMGEFKAKVVDHYTKQHKQQTQLNSNSKDPVHCSWAACDFATTRRDHFEAHHQIHFPHKPCSVPN